MVIEGSLFNPDDYPGGFVPDAEPTLGADAVPDGLDLDVNEQLFDDEDGYLTRRVALHSLDKAHYVRYYADIVGTAMKDHGPLAWVELFAGPGRLSVKDTGKFEPGSPLQALGIKYPFDRYVFADLSAACVAALHARIGDRAGVSILQGDANSSELHDQIVELVPRNWLVVLYADPEGLDVNFSTLRFFAERYPRLDLLLNFPVPGIDRALSAGQQAKAGQVLNHSSPVELMGPGTARTRTSLREYFERQLGTLGYEHFETTQVRLHQKNVPIYDMMLASRSERATQFFREALKRGPHGQISMSFDA